MTETTAKPISAMSNAALACALRELAASERPELSPIIEAAIRLERSAMVAGDCRCIMVDQGSVMFHKPEPMSVRFGESDRPLRLETREVRWLKPGEHRAVDLWGEVVIVKRADELRP